MAVVRSSGLQAYPTTARAALVGRLEAGGEDPQVALGDPQRGAAHAGMRTSWSSLGSDVGRAPRARARRSSSG